MKIVLDANIFISSFFWGGNPKTVLERVITNLDDLFITREILDEIIGVMERPKFHVSKDEIEYFIATIEEIAKKVVIKNSVKKGSRDKTDDKYIECGMTVNADYIISGNTHLPELKQFKNIPILAPKEYLDIISISGRRKQ